MIYMAFADKIDMKNWRNSRVFKISSIRKKLMLPLRRIDMKLLKLSRELNVRPNDITIDEENWRRIMRVYMVMKNTQNWILNGDLVLVGSMAGRGSVVLNFEGVRTRRNIATTRYSGWCLCSGKFYVLLKVWFFYYITITIYWFIYHI